MSEDLNATLSALANGGTSKPQAKPAPKKADPPPAPPAALLYSFVHPYSLCAPDGTLYHTGQTVKLYPQDVPEGSWLDCQIQAGLFILKETP